MGPRAPQHRPIISALGCLHSHNNHFACNGITIKCLVAVLSGNNCDLNWFVACFFVNNFSTVGSVSLESMMRKVFSISHGLSLNNMVLHTSWKKIVDIYRWFRGFGKSSKNGNGWFGKINWPTMGYTFMCHDCRSSEINEDVKFCGPFLASSRNWRYDGVDYEANRVSR